MSIAAGFVEMLEGRQLLAAAQYHTYAALTGDLQACAAAYPSITRLISIGRSVQDRDLWAMEISDNPTVQEDEPEVRYVGMMHGDEPVGQEMSMYFIDYLLSSYGSDPRITRLIDGTELWVVPDVNPDGLMLGRRGNAGWVDLNRDFPEGSAGDLGTIFDGPAMSIAGRQPETVAIMRFSAQHSFSLSANFHTGALVANYPYDSNGDGRRDYAATPDDGLFRQLALTYASHNAPMSGSAYFPQGITNGDDWYEVYGGLQDWSYRYLSDNDITVELSDGIKKPAASTLPGLWDDNRESMLSYAEAARWGVGGVVTSAATGEPVYARITVGGNSHPVFSDPDAGDYHRLLLPGAYSLTVSAPGYRPLTLTNVTVAAGAATRLDAELAPIDSAPPTVVSAVFRYDAAPPALRMQFSEDISASLSASDLLLRDLTRGQTIAAGSIAVSYDPATDTASFTFPGFANGALPDGDYRAMLAAGSVSDPAGNGLAADCSFTFFSLMGDANHDRRVDVIDLGIVASNWQRGGMSFADGDFNGDGMVDVIDLGFLATNWQVSLPARILKSGPRG